MLVYVSKKHEAAFYVKVELMTEGYVHDICSQLMSFLGAER